MFEVSLSGFVGIFCKSGISFSTQVMRSSRQRKVWVISGSEARMVDPKVRMISIVGYLSSSLVSIGW